MERFGPSGKWHGPFQTQEDAAAKSSTFPDVTVRAVCDCIEIENNPR